MALYLGLTIIDVLIRALLVMFIGVFVGFSFEIQSFLSAISFLAVLAIVAGIPYQPYPQNRPVSLDGYWHSWANNWVTMVVISLIVLITALIVGAVTVQ